MKGGSMGLPPFLFNHRWRRGMRRLTAVVVGALALGACADQPSEPEAGSTKKAAPVYAVNGNAIEGSYVVVLKEGANPTSVAAVAGIRPNFVYTAALNGFAAELNQGQLNALQHNPNVDYIEPDQEFATSTTVSAGSWGRDRIDQRTLPLSGTYNYTSTASTVYAYVIDTGIYTAHTQFGGRASN